MRRQIAYTISYMHSENICQRDLKLENILMMNNSPTSRVKITDFLALLSIEPENERREDLKRKREGNEEELREREKV